jgi:hypothetical protein
MALKILNSNPQRAIVVLRKFPEFFRELHKLLALEERAFGKSSKRENRVSVTAIGLALWDEKQENGQNTP